MINVNYHCLTSKDTSLYKKEEKIKQRIKLVSYDGEF